MSDPTADETRPDTMTRLLGADAPLATEMLLAIDDGLPLVPTMVRGIKAARGPVTNDRLREACRVLKAMEAHGLINLHGALT